MKIALLFITALVSTTIDSKMFAQENDDVASEIPALALERYVHNEADESIVDMEDIVHGLEESPIDLATVTIDGLMRIPGMTALLAASIVEWRERFPYKNISDLLNVNGMTKDVYAILSRCVTVGQDNTMQIHSMTYRQSVVHGLENSDGYNQGKYLGSPYTVRSRFTVKASQPSSVSGSCSEIRAGIMSQKDAGEPLSYASWGGYVMARSPVVKTNLLLGDYTIDAGQGLVFWHSTGFSKTGEETLSPRKNGDGIHPCLSTNENRLLRGIALETKLRDVVVQFFLSKKSINASLDSTGAATSLLQSSVFRTQADFQKWHSVTEQMQGFGITIAPADGVSMGLCGYHALYDHAIPCTDSSHGTIQSITMLGAHAAYTRGACDVFGEAAVDQKSFSAFIGGLQIRPNNNILLTIAGRKFLKNYFSLYGNAFSETAGMAKDETGIYAGISIDLMRRLTVSSYYDQFDCGAEKYQIGYRSTGNECMLRAVYQLIQKSEVTVSYGCRQKSFLTQGTDSFGRTSVFLDDRIQRNYQIDVSWSMPRSIECSSRMSWVTAEYRSSQNSGTGFMVLQDLRCRPARPLLLTIRVVFFHTLSYDSRLYSFENETAGSYSNTVLYGDGIRWYVIGRLKILKKIFLNAKYAQTEKEYVDCLGSGLDRIPGSVSSKIGIQLDCEF